MEAFKTAYATAYARLLLLLKDGRIGDIVSVDATCTSLRKNNSDWNGFHEWGPTALLPIFQVLGSEYKDKSAAVFIKNGQDHFVKTDFVFDGAVASLKVGDGVKKGDIIIRLGDKDIDNLADFRYALYKYFPGDEVEVTYVRGGDTKTTKMILGKSE